MRQVTVRRVRVRRVPPEGLGGVGDHGDTELDGVGEGEAQVLAAVAEV